MAEKKMRSTEQESIRKLVNSKQALIGSEQTLDMARKGRLSKVFIASNCPDSTRKDLERYRKLSDFKLSLLDITNEELGTICKKPFSISVISVPKE